MNEKENGTEYPWYGRHAVGPSDYVSTQSSRPACLNFPPRL